MSRRVRAIGIAADEAATGRTGSCSVPVSPLGPRWGLSPVGSNFRTALAGAIIILHRGRFRGLRVGSNLFLWEEPALTCAVRVCFWDDPFCVAGADYHRLGGGTRPFSVEQPSTHGYLFLMLSASTSSIAQMAARFIGCGI